jgi:hypothetical protein
MAEERRRRRSRRSWTEKEDAQVVASLKQNTKLQDVANELEGKLDRSWGAIMNRARILSQGLPDFQKGRTRKRWTIEDDQYLRDHWGQQTSQEIAEQLGRSEGAIKMRVSVLGFARRRRKSSAS